MRGDVKIMELFCYILLCISMLSLLILNIKEIISKYRIKKKNKIERVTISYKNSGCPYCGNDEYTKLSNKCNKCGYSNKINYKF